MHTMLSRWGCKLIGDPDDLDFLKRMLNDSITSPDNYFISMVESNFVLRSCLWDDEEFYYGAAIRAEIDLKMISGLLHVFRRVDSLRCGTIAEFSSNGLIIDEQLNFAVSLHPDHAVIDERIFRRLLYSENEKLREAMLNYSSNADWHGIFKTFEALRANYGGESAFFGEFPEYADDLRLIRRTANSHRHAFNAGDKVRKPIHLESAHRVIRAIFALIGQKMDDPELGASIRDGVRIHDFPAQSGISLLGLDIEGPTKIWG